MKRIIIWALLCITPIITVPTTAQDSGQKEAKISITTDWEVKYSYEQLLVIAKKHHSTDLYLDPLKRLPKPGIYEMSFETDFHKRMTDRASILKTEKDVKEIRLKHVKGRYMVADLGDGEFIITTFDGICSCYRSWKISKKKQQIDFVSIGSMSKDYRNISWSILTNKEKTKSIVNIISRVAKDRNYAKMDYTMMEANETLNIAKYRFRRRDPLPNQETDSSGKVNQRSVIENEEHLNLEKLIAANHSTAIDLLNTIAYMSSIAFRPDGNWIADVWGLYGFKSEDGDPTKVISRATAKADYTKGWSDQIADGKYVISWPGGEPEPRMGYYFAPFLRDPKGNPYLNGESVTTSNKNIAFMAFPASYGKTGTKAFIYKQTGTIWSIDAVKGGYNKRNGPPAVEPGEIPIKQFPSHPENEGYQRLE